MNSLVSDPVRQKFHQPFLVYIVEESFDVSFDYVIDRVDPATV
jgi:hypothetical protein